MTRGAVNRNLEERSGFRVFKQIEFDIACERQDLAGGLVIEA